MITDTISSDVVNDHNNVCGKKTKLSLYSEFFKFHYLLESYTEFKS